MESDDEERYECGLNKVDVEDQGKLEKTDA